MVITKEKIWNCLSQIPDPDIPVISITDLGLVNNVEIDNNKVVVSVTPSYSGCPAMQLFKTEIIAALKTEGVNEVEVKTVYSPAWSTDLISDVAKEKMRKHGIAPPEKVSSDKLALFSDSKKIVHCAWCNSNKTHLTSQFGSTPCKALWYCDSCHQPFEYFKCI